MKKQKLFLILSALTFAVVLKTQATIINVPADSTTIQSGINGAVNGDTVLVQPGTYVENINFHGKNIMLASLFLTTQDTSYISQTIIDGNHSGSVIIMDYVRNTGSLIGFTITNGEASLSGGGIDCSNSSPNLKYLTITGNSAYIAGGGIFCGNNSSPSLANVTITGNSADLGGGISFYNNSSPSLANATITGNSADLGGGISFNNNSSPILENVTIKGNYASDYGGGIYSDIQSSSSLANVTITGNSASYGGGIACWSSPSFDPVNRCNIFLNYASIGSDFYTGSSTVNVIVDTFTVLQPNDYFACPIDNFTFDILNGKIEQENQDLYVSPIGSNDNSGLTEDNPLLTIYYALAKIIADSINPHTIYLSNGTYSPSQTGEIFPINCRSYVSMQGEEEDSTILDGEELSNILYCFSDNNFSIENLTIQNGSAYSSGGGIYCNYSNPSLLNVTITGNSAHNGGGIYCENSNPSLVNVTITGNSVTGSYGGGGGINCSFLSSPILTNVTITGNSASDGGGIFCKSVSSPSLTNVTITGNSASDGGGIYCSSSCPSLTNVTITDNSASDGGGIYCNSSSSNPSLLNCILWNDSPQEIYIYSGSVTATYSDIQEGWSGIGNIDADPLFADTANGNFHLTWANFPTPDATKSPCIDAGDPNSPFDPDGTIADMGAFYFDQSQVTQQINLSPGFSFVSSRISPDNPDMMEVVAEIINNDLVYIRNSTGAMLRKIGPNWVNGIGDWIVTEGYLIKMSAVGQFTIGGTPIPQDTPIELSSGFQFVSYFPAYEMDALEAFSSIIGNDLLYVRNSEGSMLRKIGPNWVNGIGNCIPTEGYLIKMYADDVLIYPEAEKSSSINKVCTEYYQFKGGNPAEVIYTIYVSGLEAGDEVAAYDGTVMVGAKKIVSQNAIENELPVFSTIIEGQGYNSGNQIILKVWDSSSQAEVPVEYKMIDPYNEAYMEQVYPSEDGLYSVIKITKGLNVIGTDNKNVSIFPNPSEGIFNISIEGVCGEIQMKVFDVHGNDYRFIEIEGTGNMITEKLDLKELSAGVYFISFSGKDFSQVRKIVIQ